jgi:molybdopterin converting factor small subunit
MADVQIPPVLRQATGGAKRVQVEGADLGALLRDLYRQYPQLRAQLRVEDGLSSYVNVYLNGEDVRTLQGIHTAVSPADTVIILPAMAGGRL